MIDALKKLGVDVEKQLKVANTSYQIKHKRDSQFICVGPEPH